jgi:hypothetical protein
VTLADGRGGRRGRGPFRVCLQPAKQAGTLARSLYWEVKGEHERDPAAVGAVGLKYLGNFSDKLYGVMPVRLVVRRQSAAVATGTGSSNNFPPSNSSICVFNK